MASEIPKNFMNDASALVRESIEGLLLSSPHLERLDGFPAIKVVYDAHRSKDQVAIISGGGSGHEPAMAGYVGEGMLAAAVIGEVFASPQEDAVLAAIRKVTGPKGCLMIVMNYTGDRLNFGAAAERAKLEGLDVEMVVVSDDAALEGTSAAGRRGIAGTVLVHKAAGAAAADGLPLSQVRAVAEAASAALGSMGCSLTTCAQPGAARSARIGPSEMELGLGIHGEPGARRVNVRPANEIVSDLLSSITGPSHLPLARGDRVALLVNDLGAALSLELGVAARAAACQLLDGYGVEVERVFAGRLMSALDMHGISLTLMRLSGEGGDAAAPDIDLLSLLDAPTEAPAWPTTGRAWGTFGSAWRGKGGAQASLASRAAPVPTGSTDVDDGRVYFEGGKAEGDAGLLGDCIVAAAEAALAAKDELNRLDGMLGDADCGSTLSDGAEAAKAVLAAGKLPLDDPADTAAVLGRTVGLAMGGTSGAVYKIMLTAVGAGLRRRGVSQFSDLTPRTLGEALAEGAAAVSTYGGAKPGDRTMLDAVGPAADALQAAPEGARGAARLAADAARAGARATADMGAAKAGRASYVNEKDVQGIPDPGAVGVGEWLSAIADTLEKAASP